jgi:hypothetical protein
MAGAVALAARTVSRSIVPETGGRREEVDVVHGGSRVVGVRGTKSGCPGEKGSSAPVPAPRWSSSAIGACHTPDLNLDLNAGKGNRQL